MRFCHLAFLSCLLTSIAPASFAQDAGKQIDLTPREKIIVDIGTTGPNVAELEIVTPNVPEDPQVHEPGEIEAAPIQDVTAPEPELIQTDAFSRQAAAAAEIFIANDRDNEPSADFDTEILVRGDEREGISSKPDLPAGNIEDDTSTSGYSDELGSSLAPFYLSAKAYEDLRGGKAQAQTVLNYLYHTENKAGEKQGKAVSVDLILGEDFAEVSRNGVRKIYDFKQNRLLTIKPDLNPANPPIFDNISLFAKAFRNFSTVNKTTNRGKTRTIEIGENTLDAFWIESAMSYAAQPLTTPLQAITEDGVLYIKREDEVVLAAKPGKKDFSGAFDRDSFFALAHHEWPLHPEALQQLASLNGPVSKAEILANSPRNPEGVWHVWSLQSRKERHEPLKLDKDALSAVERKPVAPIAFIIDEAVNDRALGGLMPADKIAAKFVTQMKDEDYNKAWLTAHRYIQYTGACAQSRKFGSNDPICAGLADLETNLSAELSEDINTYIYGLARLKKAPAAGLKLLQPVLDSQETPGFVVSEIAMARARMKKRQAAKHNLTKIDAEALLKQALAKDPYNPNIYLGLAQVFAAQGSFEQSWDVYDALRAGIPTAEAVDLKIDRLEGNLLKSLPGYFLVPE